MAQLLANSPAGGPVEGQGGLFALKASDSSAAGYGVVGITAAVDILGDMRGTSPLNPARTIAGVYGISDLPPGPDTAGVLGEGLNGGIGVRGISQSRDGVQGIASQTGRSGVTGLNSSGGNGIFGQSESGRGVAGISSTGIGVFGETAGDDGVQGRSGDSGHSGVAGFNDGDGNGVFGRSFGKGIGVFGQSAGSDGVQGVASDDGHSGVTGLNTGGGNGVFGQSETGRGVAGTSNTGSGVQGVSNGGDGVFGQTSGKDRSGITGFNTGGGRGLTAVGSPAGHFDGDVEVTGDIRLLNAQDCAENFDIAPLKDAGPGTVMVLDQNGALEPSYKAYDRKVAGVISGAGDFRPGVILGMQSSARVPIALMGKVYCKIDARSSPIEVGDLLTTSDVPGHAMKAEDPQKAFGAVIGKALRPLRKGRGLVPILIALQ